MDTEANSIFCFYPPKHVNYLIFYIDKLYDYYIDEQKGHIEFDGHFNYDIGNEEKYKSIRNDKYVDKVLMSTRKDIYFSQCTYLLDGFWEIEFTHREIIQNTNAYTNEIYEDGTSLDVCFFPSNHQRLHFKVLQEIKVGDEYPKEYSSSLK